MSQFSFWWWRYTRAMALASVLLALVTMPARAVVSAPYHMASRHTQATPQQSTDYLYVNDGATTNGITGFVISGTSLTMIPGSPFPTGGEGDRGSQQSNQIAISPNDQCVFATDTVSNTVDSFAIGAGGALTEISQLTISQSNPLDVKVAPDGSAIFVAAGDTAPSYIDTFSVSSSCALTAGNSYKNIGNILSMAVAPTTPPVLYALDTFDGLEFTYTISGDTLTLESRSLTFDATPGGAAVAMVGSKPYFLTGEVNGQVAVADAYAVQAKGTITPIAGSPAADLAGVDSESILYDAVNKQAILAEQFSNSLGFFGERKGQFVLLGHIPIPAGNFPAAMAQVGSELYVANLFGGTISVCTLTLGSATCQTPTALPPGSHPTGVAGF
jgi:hypothetical protein